MITMAILFVAILLLNVIPAFAPPTWMAMSWIGFNQPAEDPLLLAVVAASAATIGRLILARCSTWLVRGHLMREADRQNIDEVKIWLEKEGAHGRCAASIRLQSVPVELSVHSIWANRSQAVGDRRALLLRAPRELCSLDTFCAGRALVPRS